MKAAVFALAFLQQASANDVSTKFEEFKQKFGKSYATAEEELKRFKIFSHNMESAEKLAGLDQGTAKYGHMSPMADMSETEFGKLNNLPVTPQLLKEHEQKAKHLLTTVKAPTSFDWRDKGAVTAVKNQAQCGSCWAFSTVANVEGQNFLQNGELLSLSEQELVDCSSSDGGCNGGLPSRAYQDMMNAGDGFELESAYGYEGHDDTCRAKKSLEKVFLDSWLPVPKDEDQIAQYLMKYGPLSIALNAGPMQMYTGGISDPWFCSPSGIDHAVTLVGFGEEDGTKFWTIKNSWSDSWGEQGYYRLIRGKGKCGMNLMVTSSVVKKADKKSTSEVYV